MDFFSIIKSLDPIQLEGVSLAQPSPVKYISVTLDLWARSEELLPNQIMNVCDYCRTGYFGRDLALKSRSE